jgi:hypothetical protein
MMTNNKCSTCSHWELHSNSPNELIGFCKRANHADVDLYEDETLTTCIKMFAEDNDRGCVCEKTDEFVAMDFYDCPGIFMTGCDFGCVHHEEKSPK